MSGRTAPADMPAPPRAMACAWLCVGALWIGLATTEVWADNHLRAAVLHERHRRLEAELARNEQIGFAVAAHVSGGADAQRSPAAQRSQREAQP